MTGKNGESGTITCDLKQNLTEVNDGIKINIYCVFSKVFQLRLSLEDFM